MAFYVIGIMPKGVGGERKFCMVEASDTIDAVMKFSPTLDSINRRTRERMTPEILKDFGEEDAFMICSTDYTDREICSKEWEDKVVESVWIQGVDDEED